MGNRIGTGAGTSVELNKKGEVDEAAENIGWVDGAAEGKKLAGGAAAEQANCIWLQYQPNSCHLSIRQSKKPAFAGKCIAVAVACVGKAEGGLAAN